MLAKIIRLFYTLWPLKLIQHWGLFYYRVLRRLVPFKPTKTKATTVAFFDTNFHTYQPASWNGGMKFNFLNSTALVNPTSWQAPEQTLLWHYNLHYFDHLNAKNNFHTAEDEAELILAWWLFHQPLQGVAWEPYPVSLRAVNLCKWGWKHNHEFQLISQKDWVAILDRHYQELKRKLEYHIQANHLFANIKALWFLQAALPEYRARDGRWLSKLAGRELGLQFDADGGHFELSPMYHRIMLWDLLDMYVLGLQVPVFQAGTDRIGSILPKAIVWMKMLSHSDTQVAFFNDAAMGIAPELDLILDYAKALNVTEIVTATGVYSGYAVATLGQARLFCDVASVGPAIQPGHVHADSLSFELSMGTQRVFVNSGTSEYGASEERLRQRSTAAHNTVVYQGRNSSDVWSGFRVGKKAAIVKREAVFEPERVVILAAHNGYKPAKHQREWVLEENSLQVKDTLPVAGKKESYFYLHPDIQVEQQSENGFVLRWNNGQISALFSVGKVAAVESTWHPKFGIVQKNCCLVVTWYDDECQLTLSW